MEIFVLQFYVKYSFHTHKKKILRVGGKNRVGRVMPIKQFFLGLITIKQCKKQSLCMCELFLGSWSSKLTSNTNNSKILIWVMWYYQYRNLQNVQSWIGKLLSCMLQACHFKFNFLKLGCDITKVILKYMRLHTRYGFLIFHGSNKVLEKSIFSNYNEP